MAYNSIPIETKLKSHAQASQVGGFDIVIMNMAMMDVSTIEPLAAALPKLLKKDGM